MTEHEVPDLLDARIVKFWNLARSRAGVRLTEAIIGADWTSMIPPQAWAFGSDPVQADFLLAQVLAGEKTATSSALDEYATSGEPVPGAGDLSIILDGEGSPGALIRTTRVDQVSFGEVDEVFALLEGESSLAEWREVHRAFFAETTGAEPQDVGEDFQVVAEHFALLYP